MIALLLLLATPSSPDDLSGSQGLVSKSKLVGKWVPVNRKSDLSRVEVRQVGDEASIQIWAKATSDEIDWGQVPLQMFSDKVDGAAFNVGRALYDPGFAGVEVLVRVEGDQLSMQVFTSFEDGSGRRPYYQSESLRRQS